MRTAVAVLSTTLCLVACSSSSSSTYGDGGADGGVWTTPSTTAGGVANISYNGAAVPPADATALVGAVQTSGGTANVVMVAMSNQTDTCGVLQRNGNPANAKMLVLSVGFAGTPTPGTYNIGSIAAATWAQDDANCNVTVQAKAVSGTVMLDTISSTMVQGSFNLTMDYGATFTGTFTAPECGADLNTVVNAPAPNGCGT
jgi:hypothetical protein